MGWEWARGLQLCTLKMTLMLGSKGGLVACETQPRKTQTLKIPIVILLKIGLGPPGKHIYISTSFDPHPLSGEKDPLMTLTVACYTLVVTQWTCMRNVFWNEKRNNEAFFYGQNGWGYKSLSIRPSPLSIASQSLHGNCQDALSWGQVTSTFSRNQSALSTPASMLSCPMLCKIGEHIVML